MTYPDNDEKVVDVPDSTLTNRQANELLAQQRERTLLNLELIQKGQE